MYLIAQSLNAKVQGDDGEEYDEQGDVIGEPEQPSSVSGKTSCHCGHPFDTDKLEDLVRYEAAVGAQSRPTDWGCALGFVSLIALLLLFFFVMFTLKG